MTESTYTPTRRAMPHFCGLPTIRFVARSLQAPTPAKAARGARAWAHGRRQPIGPPTKLRDNRAPTSRAGRTPYGTKRAA